MHIYRQVSYYKSLVAYSCQKPYADIKGGTYFWFVIIKGGDIVFHMYSTLYTVVDLKLDKQCCNLSLP